MSHLEDPGNTVSVATFLVREVNNTSGVGDRNKLFLN